MYITAVYSCGKELKKYERKVAGAKSAAVRDAAQRYLDGLRRAIDKADGLDEIFAGHMPDRDGKYIVFCPDAEEMCKLVNLAHSMFCKVNQNIRGYTVYSGDAAADKSFAAFKADDGDGSKLLYSIDMLNEDGLAWNDPEIGIEWGICGEYRGSAAADGYTLPDGTPLNLSQKDQKWLPLK